MSIDDRRPDPEEESDGDRRWEERHWDDRRRGSDRRSGLDRRGSGVRQPLSTEPRPYGFREFTERRSRQDRRIYRADGGPWDRRGGDGAVAADEQWARSLLTEEEIRYLLRCSRRGRR